MAIAGPNVQMPSAAGSVSLLGPDGAPMGLRPDWAMFYNVLQQIVFNASRSGPTASRPTDIFAGRYIGMPYFDTTRGQTVFLKSVNPDVWVNGAGTVV